MKVPGTGAEAGPRNGWAEWRRRRDRMLAKPRRNATAQRMHKARAKREGSDK